MSIRYWDIMSAIEPNTDLYKLKQVYDQNPLKELRRTQKIK